MEIQLRDYQHDLLERVQAKLEKSTSERVMMQLPTGGGKTEVAGALIADWLNLRQTHKVVWLTHREHLQTQTYNRLLGTDAKPDNPETAPWPVGSPAPWRRNGTAILSANIAGRRANAGDTGLWRNYSRNDLLVIDEAHRAAAPTWVKAIEQWPGRVVGLSATPQRLSRGANLKEVFKGNLVCGPQISWLQEHGWLCQAAVRKPLEEDVIQGGRRIAAEYNMADIERVNAHRVMTVSALTFWQKHAAGRQTIAYTVTVSHANNLAAVFNDAGIPARVITNGTPESERSETLESFKNGTIKALINVEIFTEGFDLPDASCVMLARPTLSQSLYLQMVGRGLRKKPDGGNCIILDLAGNTDRHGMPSAKRPCCWEDPPGPPGPPPIVRCPKCETISPAAAHYCSKPDCGYSFGKSCDRCGMWRAWRTWRWEHQCGDAHDLVCDLCHYDAHEGPIPGTPVVPPEVRERMEALRNLIAGKKAQREALSDDARLDADFDAYIADLPKTERPSGHAATARMFQEWLEKEKAGLPVLDAEISDLEAELEQLLG